MVGREREAAEIAVFLTSAATAASALFVEGESGIGKTALWETSLDAVDPAATVLTSRPAEAESTSSFSVLRDLLGDTAGSVLDALPGPQRDALRTALLVGDETGRRDPRAVDAGTLSLVRTLAAPGPVVIAIDDIQWIDKPSARAIGFAMRRLTSEPVALVATRRPEPTVPLLMLDAALRDRRVERLRLGPLSVGALGRIIDDQLHERFRRTAMLAIHRASAGNPLHALEIARALVASGASPAPGEPLPVPPDVRALLLERVDRLSGAERRALLLASLLSPSAESTLEPAFGGSWHRTIARLRAAGIADVIDDVVRFSHPLLASVVATTASEDDRRTAHRALADASPDPEQRARHFALSSDGPDADAASILEEAAALATRRGAPDSAAELAELAIERTPVDSAADILRRRILAGEARFSAGDIARAEEHFTRCAADTSGIAHADMLRRLGRLRSYHTDVAGAEPILLDALEHAGDDIRLRASIQRDLAVPAFASADVRASLGHANAAVELAESCGETSILSDALAALTMLGFLRGAGIRRDLMDRSLALEDWNEPTPVSLRPTYLAAFVLSTAGAFIEARDLALRAERELNDRGDETGLPHVWYLLAELDCWSGAWDDAHTRALAADRLTLETDQHPIRAITCYGVALVAAHCGDVDEATMFAEAGLAAATHGGAPLGVAMNMSALGFVQASLGNHDRAIAILDPLVDLGWRGGLDEPALLWFLPELIGSLVAHGRIDRATELTDWLEARAQTLDRARGLAAAARSRALLDAASGDTARALDWCEAALAHHERAAVPFERARTLLVRGQIARRARKWGLARESLDAACGEFERLGAKLWLATARSERERIGGRSASGTDLTESERKVAELVVRGLSNRDVAEALFLSPKTVSATLSRVYRKLHVRSRTELAARLAEH